MTGSVVDEPLQAPDLKIIGPLYIRGPQGENYRLELPGPIYMSNEFETRMLPNGATANDVLLITVMLFKAMNNRDPRPLDYWEYINRHNLGRYFVKVDGEPTDG